jgi:hypothetical protein
MGRAAVVIAPSLRRKSPQNGNIRGRGRRLSAIAAPRSANWVSGDEIECMKSRHFRAYLAFLGTPSRTPDCLAGAGGFEPPHGGIKIHCLTTWRRPNKLSGKRRDDSRADSLWQRRSIEGVEPFQQARTTIRPESAAGFRHLTARRLCSFLRRWSRPPLPPKRLFPAGSRRPRELREGQFRGKTAARCSPLKRDHGHDLSRADQ